MSSSIENSPSSTKRLGGLGVRCPECAFHTRRTLLICRHRVRLTDRRPAHLTRLSSRLLTAPGVKSIYYEIEWCTCEGGPNALVQSKCRHSRPDAPLERVRLPGIAAAPPTRDNTPSSSLCHVQAPRSLRLRMGCLSNSERLDK